MCQRSLAFVSVLGFVCVLGCGSGQSKSSSEPGGSGETTAADLNQPAEPPEHVVSEFLTGLRDGDEEATAKMMTTKARSELQSHEDFGPSGASGMTFEIGKTEFIPEKNASRVHVNWSQPDEQGNPNTQEVIFALRRQTEGWRIAGFATSMVPGSKPVFFNFEDPDSMFEKVKQAETELAKRAESGGIRHAEANAKTQGPRR